jgi:hypothetical protein
MRGPYLVTGQLWKCRGRRVCAGEQLLQKNADLREFDLVISAKDLTSVMPHL